MKDQFESFYTSLNLTIRSRMRCGCFYGKKLSSREQVHVGKWARLIIILNFLLFSFPRFKPVQKFQ